MVGLKTWDLSCCHSQCETRQADALSTELWDTQLLLVVKRKNLHSQTVGVQKLWAWSLALSLMPMSHLVKLKLLPNILKWVAPLWCIGNMMHGPYNAGPNMMCASNRLKCKKVTMDHMMCGQYVSYPIWCVVILFHTQYDVLSICYMT